MAAADAGNINNIRGYKHYVKKRYDDSIKAYKPDDRPINEEYYKDAKLNLLFCHASNIAADFTPDNITSIVTSLANAFKSDQDFDGVDFVNIKCEDTRIGVQHKDIIPPANIQPPLSDDDQQQQQSPPPPPDDNTVKLRETNNFILQINDIIIRLLSLSRSINDLKTNVDGLVNYLEKVVREVEPGHPGLIQQQDTPFREGRDKTINQILATAKQIQTKTNLLKDSHDQFMSNYNQRYDNIISYRSGLRTQYHQIKTRLEEYEQNEINLRIKRLLGQYKNEYNTAVRDTTIALQRLNSTIGQAGKYILPPTITEMIGGAPKENPNICDYILKATGDFDLLKNITDYDEFLYVIQLFRLHISVIIYLIEVLHKDSINKSLLDEIKKMIGIDDRLAVSYMKSKNINNMRETVRELFVGQLYLLFLIICKKPSSTTGKIPDELLEKHNLMNKIMRSHIDNDLQNSVPFVKQQSQQGGENSFAKIFYKAYKNLYTIQRILNGKN
jgi:hypothetical protein